MGSARHPDAATPGSWPSMLRARLYSAGGLRLVVPAAILSVAAGAVLLWRTLAWQPAATVDAWAYAAWGQALARAERPLFELGATTPKPLAALLGVFVAPLPAERAFAVVVALAAAVLVGALFAAAFRAEGTVAAAVSVVVLVIALPLGKILAFAYVDAVVAALVMLGVALRGPWRIAALILAGLLRPEAWLLAGVAGLTETRGSFRRRVLAGAIAGLAAPLLWIVSDLVLTGDPLGTLHWQSDRIRQQGIGELPWSEVPSELWSGLTGPSGAVLVIVGFVGLGWHYLRTRDSGAAGAMPLAVALIWPLAMALESPESGGLIPRYFLPVIPVLALGCGLLAAMLVPIRVRVAWPVPVLSLAAVILIFVVVFLDAPPGAPSQVTRNEAIIAARPILEPVLSCGRLGTTRRTAARGVIPQLAASTRRSLRAFGVYRPRRSFAGVLDFSLRPRPPSPSLPPWPRRGTPLGPLAISPECESQPGAGMPSALPSTLTGPRHRRPSFRP